MLKFIGYLYVVIVVLLTVIVLAGFFTISEYYGIACFMSPGEAAAVYVIAIVAIILSGLMLCACGLMMVAIANIERNVAAIRDGLDKTGSEDME